MLTSSLSGLKVSLCGFCLNIKVHSCASQVCLIEAGAFGNAAFDALLDTCYSELQAYCAEHSLQLHMTGLTRTLVGFAKSSEFPVGTLGLFAIPRVEIVPKKTLAAGAGNGVGAEELVQGK